MSKNVAGADTETCVPFRLWVQHLGISKNAISFIIAWILDSVLESAFSCPPEKSFARNIELIGEVSIRGNHHIWPLAISYHWLSAWLVATLLILLILLLCGVSVDDSRECNKRCCQVWPHFLNITIHAIPPGFGLIKHSS